MRKIFPVLWLLTLPLPAFAASPPTLAADTVEQKTQAEKPVMEITPHASSLMQVISTAVISRALPEPGLDSAGLDTPQSLGRNLWQGTNHGTAIRLVRGLPGLSSPVLRSMAGRLLVSAGEAPKKNSGGEMADQSFLEARLQELWALGLWADYAALYMALPTAAQKPAYDKNLVLAYWLTGEIEQACDKAGKSFRATPDDDYWTKMQSLCLFALEQGDKAKLAFDVWHEKNPAADLEYAALMEALFGGSKKIAVKAKNLSALHYFIAARAGVALPPELAGEDLSAQAAAAAVTATPIEARLALAEKLALRGALSGKDLMALYAQYPAGKPEDLKLIKGESKLSGEARRAVNAQYAASRPDPQQHATAVEELFAAAKSADEKRWLALSQAEWLESVPPGGEWQWFAPTGLRLAALLGKPALTRAWMDAAQADNAAKSWPYLRLARLVDSESPRGKELAEKWTGSNLLSMPEEVENRLGLVALLARALGDGEEIFTPNLLPTGISAVMLKPSDKKAASPALNILLQRAVKNNAKGEAVLLSLYMTGQAPLTALTPQNAGQTIDAWVKSGFTAEAQSLALEILVLSGL